jgi:hypothetical protein
MSHHPSLPTLRIDGQNRTLTMKRVSEVIELCLQEENGDVHELDLVGIQQITV